MTKTLNTMQFIERARIVHGKKYDYLKVKYKNSQSKVVITCQEHGDFRQNPSSHFRGSGCPSCGSIKTAKKQRKSTATFIREAKFVHGEKYNYSKTIYEKIQKIFLYL